MRWIWHALWAYFTMPTKIQQVSTIAAIAVGLLASSWSILKPPSLVAIATFGGCISLIGGVITLALWFSSEPTQGGQDAQEGIAAGV